MDYAGMVHALEEIRRLLKPESLLVDLHPYPDWLFLQVILGRSILAREPKPQTYSEDVLQAESAIADVVRRGLFTVLETIEFDFFTYASSVEDLRTHWDQIQAYDDSPKDEQILLREEQQYERFRLVMRAAGDEAHVAINERTRITGLRPESKDDGII
jgi:hypothetical protein